MLTEIHIEAFDEDLADQVFKAWDKGEIDDHVAWLAWWLIAAKFNFSTKDTREKLIRYRRTIYPP